MEPEKTAVIILAAGNSSRMHQLKAFLPFDDHTLFIEKIIALYSSFPCHEIVLVLNKEAEIQYNKINDLASNIKIIVNHHPEWERFYSVKLGLKALVDSEYCFIQNIDNPYITHDILSVLFLNRGKNHYVKPVFENRGGHPVLLGDEVIQYIKEYQQDDANLRDVISTQKCQEVEMPDDTVLININTQDAYAQLTSLLYS